MTDGEVEMADYIDFLERAGRSQELGKEFTDMLAYSTPEELNRWFSKKGFSTPLAKCIELIEKCRVEFPKEQDRRKLSLESY